jgi:hypothetical protein
VKRLVIALGLLSGGLFASPAVACSCADEGFVLPVGLHQVPVNTKIFSHGACLDPVLLNASGEPVPLALEPNLHGMVVRRPTVPLAFGGSYTIECGAVSVGGFVVEAPADTTAPPAPLPQSGPFVSDDGSSCGDEHYRTFQVVTSEAKLLLLDLEERNAPSPVIHRSTVLIEQDPVLTLVGHGGCRQNWSFEDHGQPYARWSTLDLAGNQSPWTPWDVVVDGCAMGARPAPQGAWPLILLLVPWFLRRARRSR